MDATVIYPAGEMPDEGSLAEFVIQNGTERGRTIRISRFPCLWGRGEDCDLMLMEPDDLPGISRHHCLLQLHDGQIVVEDRSTNGTLVGTTRLQRGMRAVLQVGDTVRLGPTLQLLSTRIGLSAGAETGRDTEVRRSGMPIMQPVGMAKKAEIEARERRCRPGDFRRALTALENLQQAWQRVYLNRGAAGPDGVTTLEYALNAQERLRALADSIRRNTYRPMPPRLFATPKRSGGVRTIAILNLQDRIVQQAMHNLLQDHIEPVLPDCSFAYRVGVGAHMALRRVDSLVGSGLHWVAETDIASFFDNISHRIMLEMLGRLVPDPFLLGLVAQSMAAGAVAPGLGLAQGAATSPLFSNLYLAEFDRSMQADGWNPVRYGDDLIFACKTREQAEAALAGAESYIRSRLQLSLNPNKTRVTALDQGFVFLGFHFSRAGRRPSPEAVERLEGRLQETEPDEVDGKRRRWESYFGVQGGQQHAVRAGWDEELIERYRALFVGREDCHARQSRSGAKRVFVPCDGAITADLLRRHLAGEDSLSSYLLRTDGRVLQLVLDIDATRPPGRPKQTDGPSADSEANVSQEMRDVADFGLVLAGICRTFGVPCVLVDSGRRGRHLWVLFSEPVDADMARRLGRLLAKRAGFPEDVQGVRLEILPRHSEWAGLELGDAIALPFGVHPLTGRRCFLLNERGEPIADAGREISAFRTLPASDLKQLLVKLSQWSGETAYHNEADGGSNQSTAIQGNANPGTAVSALIGGCNVIREIMRRALETGHLRHTHQLILLYTAGHLGEEGARFIHETILHCRNYDHAICQKYIDRLEVSHPPISCRRIREWLEEEGETGWCRCPSSRRSPLVSIAGFPHEKPEKKADGAGENSERANTTIEANTSSEASTSSEANEANEANKDRKKRKTSEARRARAVPTSYLDGQDWITVASDLFAFDTVTGEGATSDVAVEGSQGQDFIIEDFIAEDVVTEDVVTEEVVTEDVITEKGEVS